MVHLLLHPLQIQEENIYKLPVAELPVCWSYTILKLSKDFERSAINKIQHFLMELYLSLGLEN